MCQLHLLPKHPVETQRRCSWNKFSVSEAGVAFGSLKFCGGTYEMSRDFFRNNEMRLSDLQLCLCSGAPPAIGGTNITPWFLTQNFSHSTTVQWKLARKGCWLTAIVQQIKLCENCWVGFIVTLTMCCM